MARIQDSSGSISNLGNKQSTHRYSSVCGKQAHEYRDYTQTLLMNTSEAALYLEEDQNDEL
jgi:hypothetical protein